MTTRRAHLAFVTASLTIASAVYAGRSHPRKEDDGPNVGYVMPTTRPSARDTALVAAQSHLDAARSAVIARLSSDPAYAKLRSEVEARESAIMHAKRAVHPANTAALEKAQAKLKAMELEAEANDADFQEAAREVEAVEGR